MKILVFGAFAFLAACSANPSATRNGAEYQYQMTRLSTGMDAKEVKAILGEPYFEDQTQGDPVHSCKLYHGLARDGLPIMHEVRFTDDKMNEHIVGMDLEVMACSAEAGDLAGRV